MKAKKTLGQNFLSNPEIAQAIIQAGNIQKDEKVVEVGPGLGFLTEALIHSGALVTAIEKDDRLIASLETKFPQITLIHGDILEYTPQPNYKIIANIPYYITGEFLRRFLQNVAQPSLMVLMVQKEVAERIALTEKESILSVSIKVYGNPKYIQTIEAKHFTPIPKVDSAILGIYDISKSFFLGNKIDEERFFKIIHAGFAHKRKILIKNLEKIAEKTVLESIWSDLFLDNKIRAEDIHIDTWKNIAQRLNF